MAPVRWSTLSWPALVFAAIAASLTATPAQALRILDYNILNYPGSTGATRDPLFRTIIGPLSPDIMVTEETNSQTGVTEFLNSVLNTLEPGQWAAAPFVDGNDTDCGFFYKTAKVTYLGEWSFYPNPANHLRLVHVYRILPAGYSSEATEVRFYALHLKASTGSTNINQRLAEATGLRDSMNAMPPGTHAFALGDFNFYNTGTPCCSVEPALSKMLEDQANNTGRLYDPLGLDTTAPWQDNASMTMKHTQSPCMSGGTACASGASTGGLDDRFDLILPTTNWNDGQGYELFPDTYISVGNDGQHLNLNITDPPTIPEGATYADALIHASDHLPVRVDIQLPALISVDTTPINFGTVIMGATLPAHDISVSNPATPPADNLDYSFTGSTGFQVPAGNFSLAPGADANTHTLRMGTGSSGIKVGTATINSDALDSPSIVINLSGTVLRHAVPSLDSSKVVTSAPVDFGSHTAGGFSHQLARVHNQGYSSLQARLSVTGGTITGGNGRFSIAGGFSPALVAGAAQNYELAFDDTGATPDSTYSATLTFTSSDESLPGSTPRPDLAVNLTALVSSGSTAVGDGDAPAFTRLYAPFPNPLDGTSTVNFDLARGGSAHLEVFDLTGRHVATLSNRMLPPGHYTSVWRGIDDGGAPVGAGLYFLRLSGPGIRAQTARLAVLR